MPIQICPSMKNARDERPKLIESITSPQKLSPARFKKNPARSRATQTVQGSHRRLANSSIRPAPSIRCGCSLYLPVDKLSAQDDGKTNSGVKQVLRWRQRRTGLG